jgi:hypothetical protein
MSIRILFLAAGIGCGLGLFNRSDATIFNGEWLFKVCQMSSPKTDTEYAEWGMCLAYVTAISDISDVRNNLDGGPMGICAPTGTTVQALRETVVRMMVERPAIRKMPAAYIAQFALRQKYPCLDEATQ